MSDETDKPSADEVSIPSSVSNDAPDEMTEQIEANFGPMTVYVSSADQENALSTFNDVWETMMETSEQMHDRKQDMDDDDDEDATPTRTFG